MTDFWGELKERMQSAEHACVVFQECERQLEDSLKQNLKTMHYADNEFLHLDVYYKHKLLKELKKISEICMYRADADEVLQEKERDAEMVRYETLK